MFKSLREEVLEDIKKFDEDPNKYTNTVTLEEMQAKWDADKKYREEHKLYALGEDFVDFFRYTIPRVSRDWYYEVIYAWDRVFKGYDDRFIFSMHDVHTDMMIRALKEFRKSHMGSPIIRKQDWNRKTGDVSDDCHTYWNECLDKMIAGFEAMQQISDMDYMDKNKEERDAEEKRLRKVWKDGMKLFVEHYQGLWD